MADWLRKQNTDGVCNNLLKELNVAIPLEKKLYKNFIRMTDEDFDLLLKLVILFIEKKNTKFRDAILAATRLRITLRFFGFR